jgi:chemotaxis protein MotA
LELGTIIGFVAAFALIIAAMIILGDNPGESIMAFVDPASIAIVIGGTLASGFIAVKLKNFITGMKAVGVTFKPPVLDPASAIETIVSLANTARKEGVLALEESAANMEDQFLKKGIMLIVDGTDPELVQDIMSTELSATEDRHNGVAGFHEALATYAPSWGMLGTMVGLVLMLGGLDDPGTLGPMMAVALITTFYGCILANVIFNPVANKLRDISKEEILFKTVMVEGMLSIQAGENPRIIEEKLKSFLAPALRSSVGEGGGSVGGGGDE